MKDTNTLVVLKIVVASLLFFACEGVLNSNKNSDKPDLEESLDPIEEVILINGADNATLTVNINNDKTTYFTIGLNDIESNDIIINGLYDAWCIDVWKSINSNNGSYQNIELYSTYLVEKWKPVNYLLNIQEKLINQDPKITWLEIQLAIWSLRAYPEFDLDSVALEDLPGQFRNDGQSTFNSEKVKEILDIVNANYHDFDYTSNGVKFAVAAAMPVDVQTVIMIVEKN